jgi:predicted small metal-binding protein
MQKQNTEIVNKMQEEIRKLHFQVSNKENIIEKFKQAMEQSDS